jgi:hypothetical protein
MLQQEFANRWGISEVLCTLLCHSFRESLANILESLMLKRLKCSLKTQLDSHFHKKRGVGMKSKRQCRHGISLEFTRYDHWHYMHGGHQWSSPMVASTWKLTGLPGLPSKVGHGLGNGETPSGERRSARLTRHLAWRDWDGRHPALIPVKPPREVKEFDVVWSCLIMFDHVWSWSS